MFLALVVGELVAEIRHPALSGRKLLWVEDLGPDLSRRGRVRLAVDSVDAGVGDRVLVLDEGNGAGQVLGAARGPIRTVILGVVDHVSVESESVGSRASR